MKLESYLHSRLCALVPLAARVWPLLVARTGLRKNPIPSRGLTTANRIGTTRTHVIPLNYQQAQGKRVFYQYCVWCHADSTPAGPSNRSNLNPNPPLANDGATLNALSDDFMRNVITMGGAAAGKSASMPPWGKTLSQDDIEAVIAFYRAIAQPPYQASSAAGAQVFGEVKRIDVWREGSSRTAPPSTQVEIGSADLFLRSAAFPVNGDEPRTSRMVDPR